MNKISGVLFQKCLIVLVRLSLCKAQTVNLKQTFESNKIVPDIIPNTPESVLKVSFSDIDVELGGSLSVAQAQKQPSLKWSEKDTFYTIIMTDPDSPSPSKPTLKELQHWVVGNIYRRNISSGETFVEYTGPRDCEEYVIEEGTHRYLISVFEQIGKLIFAERRIENDNMLLRGNFSTRNFASMYRLRGPIAATFFTVDHHATKSSSSLNKP